MSRNLLAVDRLVAQHSVIGSMLADSSCVGLVVSKLSADDFSDTTCRNAFAAAKQLFIAGKPVDRVTLQDAVGGGSEWAKWARQLKEITPTSANAGAYADIVHKQASLFALRAKAQDLLESADMETAAEIVRAMSGMLVNSSQVRTWTAVELAKDFIARLSSPEPPEYLPWGIPSADRTVQAALGDYILLGGYASAGKTLLSLQMALTQAKKYRVGYYTLETQPEKMADRIFSHLSGIPLSAIKKHDLKPNELEQAVQAARLFVRNTPLQFTQAAFWSVEDITAHALSRGYQIIYIDYLQLIKGEARKTEAEQLSRISTSLKLFGQANKVTVVALAQFHRDDSKTNVDPNTGKRKEPTMQSFHGSSQMEKDADVAFLLYPWDPEDNTSPRILKLGKNKDGPRSKCTLSFHGATQTMEEMPEDKSKEVARHYQALGQKAKQRKQRARDPQVTFQDLSDEDETNPFLDKPKGAF